MRNLFFTLLVFIALSELAAQDSSPWDDVSVSAHYHYGAILPEYSSFTYLTNDYTKSFDLQIEKSTRGKNFWQQLYAYPSFGLSFYTTTLGNNNIHGREYALFPYFKFPLIASQKFSFSTVFGLGIGYVTKKYDPIENPYNVVIGSKFNIHFQANFMARAQLTEKWSLDLGLAFAHFSNGNSAEPNIGINNLSLNSGLSYLIGTRSTKSNFEIVPPDKRFFWELGIAPGKKSTRALQSTNHFALSISGDLWKPLTHAVSIGVGPDLFYDTSAKIEMSQNSENVYSPRAEWSSGMHVSFSLRYSKFRVILQGGAYVFLENLVIDEPIYNRAIFRYDLAKNIYVHFAMKSHLHILDYPEIGIGYRWKRD